MTAEQKTQLASFLDLSADTLRGGYTREREPCAFTDGDAVTEVPAGKQSDGKERPLLMLIGEGLGADGAAKLAPEAAQLLDKMLASIGLFRGKNCVSGAEVSVLRPRFILCLGSTAQIQNIPHIDGGIIPTLTTYHPDELLLDPSLKRPAWEDLKTLRAELMELDADYARAVSARI